MRIRHCGLLLCLAFAGLAASAGKAGAAEGGYLFQIEAGPSATFFAGGGASEGGAGFSASLSLLEAQGADSPRFGFRIGYAGYFFENIEGVPGQELREQVFTVGAVGEVPVAEFLTVHFHGGLGGVASKADVAVPFSILILAVDTGGFITELGGGLRVYPIENLYLSGELNVNLVVGSAADLAKVNFRASVLLGGSF